MITFDAVASIGGSGATLTWAHTIGAGNNRLLVVGFSQETASDVTGVTFNGVALTKAKDIKTGDGFLNVELWYLLNPPVGTYNVVVSCSGDTMGSSAGGSMSFFGVKQQAPEATASNSQNSGTSISQNITTLTNNAILVDVMANGNDASLTPNGAQTGKYTAAGASNGTGGSYKIVPTAGASSMSWSTTNFRNGLCIAAFAEEPSSGRSFGQVIGA